MNRKIVVILFAVSLFAGLAFAAISRPGFKKPLSQLSSHLEVLTKYIKASSTASPVPGGPSAEDISVIKNGLHEQELEVCSQVLIQPGNYPQSDVAHCQSMKDELEAVASVPRADLTCQIKLPLIQEGCEGELCGCRTGPTAIKDTDLLQEPRMGAPKVGSIKKGERAAEFDFWMRIEELGEATFAEISYQTEKLGLRPGDRISVVQYGGEGVWIVCLGGQQEGLGGDMEPIEIVREPKRTGWVRIKTQKGIVGYAPEGFLEDASCG